MKLERKLELLSDVLELSEEELNAQMALSNLDGYNSMAKLALIVMMEDEFGKVLTNNDIKEFVTVQDILDFMEG